MKKFLFIIGVLLGAAAAFAAGNDYDAAGVGPQRLLELNTDEVRPGSAIELHGTVAYVSSIESGRFLVTPTEQPYLRGVIVDAEEGAVVPTVGDIVQVYGRLKTVDGANALDANRVVIIRRTPPPQSGARKQADYRRGLLDGRRLTLSGTIHDLRVEAIDGVEVTHLGLSMEKYIAHVIFPGQLTGDNFLGRSANMTGLVRGVFAENGKRIETVLELSGADDVELIEEEGISPLALSLTIILAALLLSVTGASLVMWRRSAMKQHEMDVIAEERRRMAADLHDTIEQHLAGANLIAAGVMSLENVPENVAEAMRTLSGLLANAKTEVRSAVLNLRSDALRDMSLKDAIEVMARGLAKTGLRVRRCLRGLPDTVPEGMYQDILLIAREAATNAVKHGKASEVVITSDPIMPDGFELKVLNNGARFEIDKALGPETGHYGLAGMKERALRNNFKIDWGVQGRWTFMKLEVRL